MHSLKGYKENGKMDESKTFVHREGCIDPILVHHLPGEWQDSDLSTSTPPSCLWSPPPSRCPRLSCQSW